MRNASIVLHCSCRLPFSPRPLPTTPNRAPPLSAHPEPRSPLPPSAHHHSHSLSRRVNAHALVLRLAYTTRCVARPTLCADITPSIATLFVAPARRVRPRATRRQPRPLRSTNCARPGSVLGSALKRVARPIAGRDRSRVLPSSTANLPRCSRPLRASSDASAFATTPHHPSSPPLTCAGASALARMQAPRRSHPHPIAGTEKKFVVRSSLWPSISLALRDQAMSN